MNKVAIFDFCETLVGFQSADPYLRFVLKKQKKEYHEKSGILRNLLNKIYFHISNVSLNKQSLLKQTKGISEREMDQYAKEYYNEMIKPALITSSVDYLDKLKEAGYTIIIASAGFDIYIKYFGYEHNVDMIICTQISFTDGTCDGKINGYDLIGSKKAKEIKERIGNVLLAEADSIAISDSRSDLPMLHLCKKKMIVCKKKPSWIEKDMEMIKWN